MSCCDKPCIGPGSLSNGGGGNTRSFRLTRELPTIQDWYTWIGRFTGPWNTVIFDVLMCVAESGFTLTARYFIGVSDILPDKVWLCARPVAFSASAGNRVELEVYQDKVASEISLRLRRSVGTTAGTADITFFYNGVTDFTSIVGTFSGQPPAADEILPNAVLTQEDYQVIIESIGAGTVLKIVEGSKIMYVSAGNIRTNDVLLINDTGENTVFGGPVGIDINGFFPTALLDIGPGLVDKAGLRLRSGAQATSLPDGGIDYDGAVVRGNIGGEIVTIAQPAPIQHSKFFGNIESTVISALDTPVEIAANWRPVLDTLFVLDTKLDYSGQTGNFTIGQTVTDFTTGASGTIIADTDTGTTGTLTILVPAAPALDFNTGNSITDPITGSATLDRVWAEIRYTGSQPAVAVLSGQAIFAPIDPAATAWTLLAAKNGTVDRPGFWSGLLAGEQKTYQISLPLSVVTDDTLQLQVERTAGVGDLQVQSGRMSVYVI